MPVGLPRFDGRATPSATMRAFRAGRSVAVDRSTPGRSSTATTSPRFRDRRRLARAPARRLGLQMTTPGVPMVFAGDELGLEGALGRGRAPDDAVGPARALGRGAARRATARLIALRRSSDALARGGIRYAHVAADAIAYLRETRDERLLCLAARADTTRSGSPLDALGCAALETARRRRRCRRRRGVSARRRPGIPRLEAHGREE